VTEHPAPAPHTRGIDGERTDERSDLQQAVEARADAVARGDGGPEPSPMTDTGEPDGVGGTGGEVRNQGPDQQ